MGSLKVWWANTSLKKNWGWPLWSPRNCREIDIIVVGNDNKIFIHFKWQVIEFVITHINWTTNGAISKKAHLHYINIMLIVPVLLLRLFSHWGGGMAPLAPLYVRHWSGPDCWCETTTLVGVNRFTPTYAGCIIIITLWLSFWLW